MARWFRSHAAKLDNPKVQQLSDALYRAWDMLLCVASLYDGVLPTVERIAFHVRRSEAIVSRWIEALIAVNLFVKTERGIEPHDWGDWQYKSDVSTDRVKRHRERQRNVSSTVSGTDSENREQRTDSVPNGTGGAPPSDPVKELFDAGVKLLIETGSDERNARSIIGKFRKEHGDEAVMGAIAEARRLQITEPIAWMTQRFAGASKPRESWNQRRIREGLEALGK